MIEKDKYRERKRERDAKIQIIEDEPKIVIHKEIQTLDQSDETKYNTFGVIKLKTWQYKVTQDDLIWVSRIPELSIGQLIQVKDVLLIGNKDFTILGRPVIKDASVYLRVEEQTRT